MHTSQSGWFWQFHPALKQPAINSAVEIIGQLALLSLFFQKLAKKDVGSINNGIIINNIFAPLLCPSCAVLLAFFAW